MRGHYRTCVRMSNTRVPSSRMPTWGSGIGRPAGGSAAPSGRLLPDHRLQPEVRRQRAAWSAAEAAGRRPRRRRYGKAFQAARSVGFKSVSARGASMTSREPRFSVSWRPTPPSPPRSSAWSSSTPRSARSPQTLHRSPVAGYGPRPLLLTKPALDGDRRCLILRSDSFLTEPTGQGQNPS
jgi:hypothetical protein